MYALSPRALHALELSGIHFRQSPRAHVTTITCMHALTGYTYIFIHICTCIHYTYVPVSFSKFPICSLKSAGVVWLLFTVAVCVIIGTVRKWTHTGKDQNYSFLNYIHMSKFSNIISPIIIIQTSTKDTKKCSQKLHHK